MGTDDMNAPQTFADASIDDLMEGQRRSGLLQRARLRAHIEATNPGLAGTYRREEKAFSALADTILEPALAEIAEGAQAKGLYVQIYRESPDEGIFGIVTPGIRLLVSRKPLPGLNAIAYFGQTSFLGFHGNCPDHSVKMVTENHWDVASSSVENSECVMAYEDLHSESVKTFIAAFLDRL